MVDVPSDPRPRTKPAETRRDELLTAAEALFLSQGVEATRIDQITDAAGVAKGTFYLHFASKEAVRAAMAERLAERHRAATRLPTMAETWTGRLLGWTEASVGFCLDTARLRDVVGPGGETVLIDDLGHLIANGMQAGLWTVDDARATAAFILGGLRLTVDQARGEEKHVIRSRLIRRVQRLALRAVGLDD
jgi:AcrR family transcriptional regulator